MDWHIVLEDESPLCNFMLKDVQGETEWDTTNKCAVIRIIRPEEYGKRILPFVKEKVLLHELLHIKFGLLWESNNKIQNSVLHQYIEDMAKTLYKVHTEQIRQENAQLKKEIETLQKALEICVRFYVGFEKATLEEQVSWRETRVKENCEYFIYQAKKEIEE